MNCEHEHQAYFEEFNILILYCENCGETLQYQKFEDNPIFGED
ncbi:MAG: hypothetical protein R3321_13665 [Nitrososphaeraceae archaeon]|nr:hypothetical protein [Nitrososphaeraceae archaeon]